MPPTQKDQTFKSKSSLLTRRKHLTVTGEENKHTNVPSTLKTRILSQRSRISNLKSTFQDGNRFRGLYICSFVTNIRDYTPILCNSIQISFVHIFVIIDMSTLQLFGTYNMQPHILRNLFKPYDTTNNLSQQ